MENINLLHDRGDDDKDAKTQRTGPVAFTQPDASSDGMTSSQKPKGGFWRSVADALGLFGGVFGGKRKPSQTDEKHRADGTPDKNVPHIMSIELEHPSEKEPEPRKGPKEEVEEKNAPPAAPHHASADPAKAAPPSVTDPKAAGGAHGSADGTNLGVNLVPEEFLHGAKRHNQVLLYGLSVGLSVLLIALVFVGVTLFERNIVKTTEERQDEIAAIDQDLKALSATKQQALQLDNDLAEIVTLLDAHTYWTKFFSLIEQYTVDTVSFTSAAADQSGRLSLSAQGRDFRSVARQLVAFQEATDLVKDVTITSASLATTPTGSVVTFSVSIQFVDTAFRCSATDCPTVGS